MMNTMTAMGDAALNNPWKAGAIAGAMVLVFCYFGKRQNSNIPEVREMMITSALSVSGAHFFAQAGKFGTFLQKHSVINGVLALLVSLIFLDKSTSLIPNLCNMFSKNKQENNDIMATNQSTNQYGIMGKYLCFTLVTAFALAGLLTNLSQHTPQQPSPPPSSPSR